jgi:hypothetical protein
LLIISQLLDSGAKIFLHGRRQTELSMALKLSWVLNVDSLSWCPVAQDWIAKIFRAST